MKAYALVFAALLAAFPAGTRAQTPPTPAELQDQLNSDLQNQAAQSRQDVNQLQSQLNADSARRAQEFAVRPPRPLHFVPPPPSPVVVPPPAPPPPKVTTP